MKQQQRILLIGAGNTLKGDDGIGAYICKAVQQMHIAGVSVLAVHQLDTNLLEEMTAADIVIVADASVNGINVSFLKQQAGGAAGVTSPHYMSVSLLMQMAKLLYNRDLTIYVCSVAGYDFDTAEQLSPGAKKNADKAVGIISTWIMDNS